MASIQACISLKPDLYAEARRVAEEKGQPFSVFVARALTAALAQMSE